MQQQVKNEESVYCPSFSFYSSDDSLTSTAVAKVIREEDEAQFHEFGDVNGDDFEFSLELTDEQISTTEIDSRGWTVFPVFNRGLIDGNELDREVKSKDSEINVDSPITDSLRKLFIDEHDESSSCSSSEADELENVPSGTYCVWRPKSAEDESSSSSPITKCKKSSSTGSGSKRWSIRYLLRRSNSEGKEPMMLLTPKKVDSVKRKRNSGEVSKVAGRLKVQTPVHEQFYVQRRAENEVGKRKSYLPYRKDLVGLFGNVNGMGKMLPF